MIEVDRAQAILLDAVELLGVEEIGLDGALGRVLAEPVLADRDLPPTDRSAMDGFAVRAEDLPEAGRTLRCVGEVRAGQAVGRVRVGPGEAVRILTGAIVPPGIDTVVMVEQSREGPGEGEVTFLERPRPGQHIRRRGEEVRAGDRVLAPDTLIHAPEVATLASVGRTRVAVHRRPGACVLSTGDEVVEPDQAPAPFQVRNSNARALLAQLEELGIEGEYLGIASDTREVLEAGLARGLAGDLLLITGGVSVGTYDLVREALERAGMELLFHKVAMRPGKPVLAGKRGACLVVGLPGNPVSAFIGFQVLVAPALRKMMGLQQVQDLRVRAVLSEPLPAKRGRTTFHLARVEWSGGQWAARRVKNVSSGDVLSLSRANAYLVTPPDAQDLEMGNEVPAVLWRDSHLRRAR